MSQAGKRILRSGRRTRAYARGETTEGFVVHVPENVDVKAIRIATGLNQEAFALRYGFSPGAVRDWEQHRRQPEAAARVLLLVIAHNPAAVTAACRQPPGVDQSAIQEEGMVNHTKARCAYCGKPAHRSIEKIANPHAQNSPEWAAWVCADIPGARLSEEVHKIITEPGGGKQRHHLAWGKATVPTWVLDEDPFCSLACLRSFATEAFHAGVRMQERPHV